MRCTIQLSRSIEERFCLSSLVQERKSGFDSIHKKNFLRHFNMRTFFQWIVGCDTPCSSAYCLSVKPSKNNACKSCLSKSESIFIAEYRVSIWTCSAKMHSGFWLLSMNSPKFSNAPSLPPISSLKGVALARCLSSFFLIRHSPRRNSL